jgi:hypothetical protein
MDRETIERIVQHQVRDAFASRDLQIMIEKLVKPEEHRLQTERISEKISKETSQKISQETAERVAGRVTKEYVQGREFEGITTKLVRNEFNTQVLTSHQFTTAVTKHVQELSSTARTIVDQSQKQIQAASVAACDALADAKYRPMFDSISGRAAELASAVAQKTVEQIGKEAKEAISEIKGIQKEEKLARQQLSEGLTSLYSLSGAQHKMKTQYDEMQFRHGEDIRNLQEKFQEKVETLRHQQKDIQNRQYVSWGIGILVVLGILFKKS